MEFAVSSPARQVQGKQAAPRDSSAIPDEERAVSDTVPTSTSHESTEKPRVLVTGGHGFIGSFVVRRLRERGYPVRCLVRRSSRTHRIDDLDVDKVIGDILDPASLAAAMEGCELCIHLAGISSYADMDKDFARPTIVDGTRNVFEAALAAGLRRVVYIGSGIVYASHDPNRICDEESSFELEGSGLIYAEAKHENERQVDEFVARGLDIVVAIPMETYGPHDDEFLTTGYLKEAINGWPAMATRGGTMYGHVADVAEGIVLALEKGRTGHRYILGSENGTIEEIIKLALEVAGKKKKVLVMPTGLTRFVVRTLYNLGLPSPEHPNAIEYGTLYAFARNDKARQELGWNPRSGREVLEDTVRWLREAGHIR
ncbi:MAG: NAD-dependent epimerase/dehydratase family protein [Deltaproteobacteria bacterium]|nr:MAG: NAD-dependent epimerase/dehydratase family protein [Deltaproteobacteria bacterium]